MSDIFRNLLRAGLTADQWLTRNDASRNAIFGYNLGRLQISGGDANDIECELLHPQGFSALQDGATMWFIPGLNNTGPVTMNIQGIGAVPLRDGAGDALGGGELEAGKVVLLGFHDVESAPELRIVLTGAVTPPSISVDVQTFDTSGTWIKPDGAFWIMGRLWGAGGGGHTAAAGGGGGGGACADGEWSADTIIESSLSVTIGAGGAAGSAGGNSSFGSYLTAYGGGRGFGSNGSGGGGGGRDGAGQNAPSGSSGGNGGAPDGGEGGTTGIKGGISMSGGGGGGGSTADGGDAVYGGGGGAGNNGKGGSSTYGGGGGAGSGGTAGGSLYGGAGGAAGAAGTVPAGGGGRQGAGANGKCIVTTLCLS